MLLDLPSVAGSFIVVWDKWWDGKERQLPTLVLTAFFDLITALSLGAKIAALRSARRFERL